MMQYANHIQAAYCQAANSIKLQQLNSRFASQRLAAVTETATILQQYFYWCRLVYNTSQNNVFIQQAELQHETEKALYMAITDKHTGHYLGEVGYDWKTPDSSCVNVFYWIRKTAQQKGYAGLAMQAFMQYLRLNKIAGSAEIKIIPENTASKKIAVNAGAVYSHTLNGIIMPLGYTANVECYKIFIHY